MKTSKRPAFPCTFCHSTNGHTENCPEQLIKELSREKLHIHCSECGRNRVELNESDYFECEYCHAQFTTDLNTDAPTYKTVTLFNDKRTAGEALVMKERGKGKFRVGRAIAEQQIRMKDMLTRRH